MGLELWLCSSLLYREEFITCVDSRHGLSPGLVFGGGNRWLGGKRGVSVVQASRDLDIGENVLRRWIEEFGSDPGQAFPGQGQVKPGQQEIDRLRRESLGLLREGVDVKFGFIAKHRGVWPVRWLCEALGVLRSGFHAWLARPRSARPRSDETLGVQVKASFVVSERTYGARHVWHDMLTGGATCGLHRIERLMRDQALQARPRRRKLPSDTDDRNEAAPKLLDRQFVATAPNQKCIDDFTYIWTAEDWLYVAAVIERFSRRVVGWSMSATMAAQLVAAIWRRGKRMRYCITWIRETNTRVSSFRSDWQIMAPVAA